MVIDEIQVPEGSPNPKSHHGQGVNDFPRSRGEVENEELQRIDQKVWKAENSYRGSQGTVADILAIGKHIFMKEEVFAVQYMDKACDGWGLYIIGGRWSPDFRLSKIALKNIGIGKRWTLVAISLEKSPCEMNI